MHQPIDQPESPYEQLRRAQNIVTLGTVAEVRTTSPSGCRVAVNGETTDWLPWLTLRAGNSKQSCFWWPPDIGEQVVVLAPGGDMRQGVVLTSVFSDARPEPEGNGTGTMLMRWDESDWMEHSGGKLRINMLMSYIEITHTAIRAGVPGATLVFDASGLHVTPEIAVGPIKLTEHKHSKVTIGTQVSGEPVP